MPIEALSPDNKRMTVVNFCLNETRPQELVVVRDCGHIVGTVWIDYEDLFARSMSSLLGHSKVKSHEWGMLTTVTEHGDKLQIPCHYVDIV